jgi:hypothetical protein
VSRILLTGSDIFIYSFGVTQISQGRLYKVCKPKDCGDLFFFSNTHFVLEEGIEKMEDYRAKAKSKTRSEKRRVKELCTAST